MDAFLRWFYRKLAFLVYKVMIPYEIIGWENVPDLDDGPYLLIGNHFSYFEVPILGALILNKKLRAFAAPDTLGEFRLIDSVYRVFDEHIIYVKRGAVDRKALQAGLQALRAGNWLMIFPEGGITEDSLEVAKGGESTVHMQGGYYTREPAVLLPARPGAAMLATQTKAKILPVAFLGTEQVEGNLRQFKRTKITITIGEPIGPLTMPDGVRGRERRAYLDSASDKMMMAIAELLPEKNRGPYQLINE